MTVSRQQSKHMSFGRKHQRRSRAEYSFYFALIFLAALPICILQWVYALVTTTDRLNIGPSPPRLERGTVRYTTDILGILKP